MWAHPGHVGNGTGLTTATSAPGLGSPLATSAMCSYGMCGGGDGARGLNLVVRHGDAETEVGSTRTRTRALTRALIVPRSTEQRAGDIQERTISVGGKCTVALDTADRFRILTECAPNPIRAAAKQRHSCATPNVRLTFRAPRTALGSPEAVGMARLPRAQRRCHRLRFGRALPVCRHRRLAGAWGSIAMYKSRLEVTAAASELFM